LTDRDRSPVFGLPRGSARDFAGSVQSLIDAFREAGQGQVFAFLDRLGPAERARLFAEAAEVDLAELAALNRSLLGGAPVAAPADLEPAPYVPLPGNGGDRDRWRQAREVGEVALRAGRVAAFTVAGGQGTRLGFEGPKGTFPVTPVRQRPLFAVFADKLLAAERRYGRRVPWFILTSHQNHAATEAFFAQRRWFGLRADQVHFLRQGRMPAVDASGRILLETPGSLALSPDGHGGSLRALERAGALDRMAAVGADLISYFQVDNPLVRVIDPTFIGWHLLSGSEMSSKMVPKAFPEEKVGLFCRHRGRTCVIEYSDLALERQREVDPATGRLRFLAGSIAIHLFSREFARRVARGESGASLPFHRAVKKIPTIDSEGRPVQPSRANGIKFELFVFDALPFAANPLVLETDRAGDFAPVKNAEGVDSPATCRDAQLRLFAGWLRACGATLSVDPSGLPPFPIEVSPRFGDDLASFTESWTRLDPKPAAVTPGFCLGHDS
jgi:UDP-N-acetylglucosamine/UDP-N-acetylgalactosamine diphosphorylase